MPNAASKNNRSSRQRTAPSLSPAHITLNDGLTHPGAATYIAFCYYLAREEEANSGGASHHDFAAGDLVWGPARGCPAWPGKVVDLCEDKVTVMWFGGDKSPTEVDPCNLQTLSEGLDAHHQAGKKTRT